MDVQPIIDRLKALATGFRDISGVASMEAAMRGHVDPPSAFVVPLAEQPGPARGMSGNTSQRVAQMFGVILVLETLRDASGAEVLLDLKTARESVSDALFGWVPDAAAGEPVVFTGGELVQFEGDGRLWWSDEFQLFTHKRRTQ